MSKRMKNRTLYSIIILCQREHAEPDPAVKMCSIDSRPTMAPRANITLPLDGKIDIQDDSFNSNNATQANNLK